jgi:hypothetical protein
VLVLVLVLALIAVSAGGQVLDPCAPACASAVSAGGCVHIQGRV